MCIIGDSTDTIGTLSDTTIYCDTNKERVVLDKTMNCITLDDGTAIPK